LTGFQHNDIVVLVITMIPEFNSSGNLPPGIHYATWAEVEDRFGIDAHRTRLLAGMKEALQSLKIAGCKTVFVDGSFVTQTDFPADFDACWEMTHVDLPTLYIVEPVLFDFRNRRAAQKAKFQGELFPSQQAADNSGRTFLEFFQIDKNTGEPKGIVAVDLGSLP
jgi:hypothetical protein